MPEFFSGLDADICAHALAHKCAHANIYMHACMHTHSTHSTHIHTHTYTCKFTYTHMYSTTQKHTYQKQNNNKNPTIQSLLCQLYNYRVFSTNQNMKVKTS